MAATSEPVFCTLWNTVTSHLRHLFTTIPERFNCRTYFLQRRAYVFGERGLKTLADTSGAPHHTHTDRFTFAVATTTTTAIRLSYRLPDLESSLFDPLIVIIRSTLVCTVIFVCSVAPLGPFRVL